MRCRVSYWFTTQSGINDWWMMLEKRNKGTGVWKRISERKTILRQSQTLKALFCPGFIHLKFTLNLRGISFHRIRIIHMKNYRIRYAWAKILTSNLLVFSSWDIALDSKIKLVQNELIHLISISINNSSRTSKHDLKTSGRKQIFECGQSSDDHFWQIFYILRKHFKNHLHKNKRFC